MKSVILLDSSYPINSRNSRILNSLKKQFCVSYITWKRDDRRIESDEFDSEIYIRKSKYGNKIFKLINLVWYYYFIKKHIHKKNPSIVIASHWDMLIIASILKKKNNFKLIYENLDMPDSNNKIIRKILCKLEHIALQKSDGMILASRFFSDYYDKKNQIIFENYTFKHNIDYKKKQMNNSLTRIAFIGNIRHYEILTNLIKAFENNKKISIEMFGTGIVENNLKRFCQVNKINNVNFHGRYDYKNIHEIYSDIDYVWSAYPSDSFNVQNAISNKFFEVISNKKIGIFSKDTQLGKFVSEEKIGLTVNPYSVEDIKNNILDFEIQNKKTEILDNISLFIDRECIYWEENEVKLINFVSNILRKEVEM